MGRPSLAAYITSAPESQQASLKIIRKAIRSKLPGAKFSVSENGFPVCSLDDQWLAGFASRSKHPMLYIMAPEVLDQFESQLGKLRTGKSCVAWKIGRNHSEKELLELANQLLEAVAKAFPQAGKAKAGNKSSKTKKLKVDSAHKWRDKLEREQEPKIVDIPPKMQKQWGIGTMAIARPLDIDVAVRKIRKGKLVEVKEIMEDLAKGYGADKLCPMTTGIFLRIVAEAAEEDLRNGKKRVAPYWRVLKTGGKLNEKYPGGVEAQAERLRLEGFVIVPGKGKQPPKVADFDRT